mgnify:FL=1
MMVICWTFSRIMMGVWGRFNSLMFLGVVEVLFVLWLLFGLMLGYVFGL